MFKRKETPIDSQGVTINHLRSLDNRQYKWFMQAVERFREADKHLDQSNKPTGDDKVIDDVHNAFIETEGK